MKKTILCILFAAYGLLMLWLLFGQRMGHIDYGNYAAQLRDNTNLVPFSTVTEFTRTLLGGEGSATNAFINLAGNVVMLIPLGFFLPATVRFCRTYGKTLLISAAVIVCVELIQLFSLLGSCDTDDLILNLIGVSLGYLMYRAFEEICKRISTVK